METKQCRKCGEIKPIGSFPKRYGKYTHHLREHACGMCKKRANLARHPEKLKIWGYRRTARSKGIDPDVYIAQRAERKARIAKEKARIKVRRCRRTKCPVLSDPKIEYRINRDYYIQKSRRWSRENPAKQLAKKQRRRARLMGCDITLTLNQWNEIKRRYRNRCAYCGRKRKLTRDHVVPLIQVADDSPSNIVPACWQCNSSKGVRRPPRPVQTLLFA